MTPSVTRRAVLANAAAFITAASVERGSSTVPSDYVRMQPGQSYDPQARIKVIGLGHSFIQRGAYSGRGPNYLGTDKLARGVLSQIASLDRRFNLDIFHDTKNFGFVGANSLSGSHQGIGGDHLLQLAHAPGTINRTPYIVAREHAIVYLDIGTNDISSGVGGHLGKKNDCRSIIAALDEQITMLVTAGIIVIVQTVAWRLDWFDANPSDVRLRTIHEVNSWISEQKGRMGVYVADTQTIDGTSHAKRHLFSSDGVHPNQVLAAARADILLPILRAVAKIDDVDFAAASNPVHIFAAPEMSKPGGQVGKGVSGDVAAGWRLERAAGSGLMFGEVVTRKHRPWQSLTARNRLLTGGLSSFRMCAVDVPLESLQVRGGDWLEFLVEFELDDWEGWAIDDRLGQGAISFMNEFYIEDRLMIEANDHSAYCGRKGMLTAKIEVPANHERYSLRYGSRPIMIRWRADAPGTGQICIRSPLIRAAADPRSQWLL